MPIRKQIVRIFGTLAVIVSIGIGIVYFVFSSLNYREDIYGQLEERASVSSQQMSDIVEKMQLAFQVAFSDQDVLQAINTLSRYDEETEDYNNLYFSDAYTTVQTMMNSYFIYKSFYRMIYFNENGVVIVGTTATNDQTDSSIDYSDLKWLELVDSDGSNTLLHCHPDDWGRSKYPVISMVKCLVGNNLGYLEVQLLKEDLDEYFNFADSASSVYFYNLDGDQIYAYGEEEPAVDYYSYVEKNDFQNISMTVKTGNDSFGSRFLRNKVMFVSHLDKENGIITVVSMPADTREEMLAVIPILLLIIAAFLFSGLGYVVISSGKIARPILALREIMEDTKLENLTTQSLPEKKKLDLGEEMEALYESYFNVLERLGASVEEERRLSVLQLEAQFGLLQAQVNPHFLYNILNVISSKGIMANDESICDICAALSRMLRYSTNTKAMEATVKEEAEYLQTYLTLMKYRYEDRLEYTIDIQKEVEKVVMPKVTLEQIVENCFQHGYLGKMQTIRIAVIGETDGDRWRIRIRDNGVGFSREKIEELYSQFEETRKQLSMQRGNIEMEIGGMGLVNVYARLYLTFGESMIFSLKTMDEGAEVVIEADYRKEEV